MTGPELIEVLRGLSWTGPARVAFLVEKPAPGVHELRDRVTAVAGFGFEGNHPRTSWWRGRLVPGREVTAIAFETLRAMALPPDVSGDNLVTEGLDLKALRPGDRVRIGDVVLERGEEDHRPCALFRDRAGQAAFEAAAAGWRGALFTVRSGGPIEVGDPIELPV